MLWARRNGRQARIVRSWAGSQEIDMPSFYTHQFIDERLMSMRFELIGECAAVNLVVAYAPTEANPNAELKEVFLEKVGALG